MKKLIIIALSIVLALNSCKKEEEVKGKEPVKIIEATGLSIDPSSLSLTEGESKQIVVSIIPKDVSSKTIIWASSDASIATVEDGLVKALKKGNVEISAKTENNVTSICKLLVNKKIFSVESITLNKSTLKLNVEDSEELEVSILPSNADNKNIVWTSSDINIAYVIRGLVRAKSAGSAIITVTTEDGNKTATCSVEVIQPIVNVTAISLNTNETTLILGNKILLTAEVLPKDASNKNISWSSSDKDIVSVTKEGLVTALKVGQATIKVITEDGNKEASCKLIVENTQEDYTCIDLDGKEYTTIVVGDQVWMAENYAYLPNVTNNNDASRIKPKCYVYEYMGDDVNEAKALDHYKKYGAMYNWQAAMKYAPEGWHLPSDEEWKTFEKALGMSEKEANGIYRHGVFGKKFKSTAGWKENGNGTNEFNFNVLPAGAVSNDLLYVEPGEVAYFWSSTDSEGSYYTEAFVRRCYYSQDSFLRYKHDINSGMCVRYVRSK